MSDAKDSKPQSPGRRQLLRGLGAGAAALAFPHLWLPREARAQTARQGAVRPPIYMRLSGVFRCPAAFSGAVAAEFTPYGRSDKRASGTEWGVSKLRERAS